MRNFRPISSILGFLWHLGREIHQRHLLKKGMAPEANIWVIGSQKVGGAGRTSLTKAIATEWLSMGYNVEILCNSLGRTEKQIAEGDRFPYISDDAIGLYRHLKCPVHTTRNRTEWFQKNELNKDTIYLCDGGLEDPGLAKARHIIIHSVNKIKLGDLLPMGKYRSLEKDHPNPFVNFRENKDFYFKYPQFEPSQKTKILVTSGGDAQLWVRTLLQNQMNFDDVLIRPNHDPNFYPFLSGVLQQNPKSEIYIGTKERAKLPLRYKNKNLFYIEPELIINDPKPDWLSKPDFIKFSP